MLLAPPLQGSPFGQYKTHLDRLDAKLDSHFSEKAKPEEALVQPLIVVERRSWRMAWIAAASIAVLVTVGVLLFTQPAQPIDSQMNIEPVVAASAPSLEEPITDSMGQNIAFSKRAKETNATFSEAQSNPLAQSDSEERKADVKMPEVSTTDVITFPSESNPSKAADIAEAGSTYELKTEAAPKPTSAEKPVANNPKPKNTETKPTSTPYNTYPGAAIQNSNIPSDAYETAKEQRMSKRQVESALSFYQEGMLFYKKENYAQALSLFNRVLAIEKSGMVYENTLWYAANAYLKWGKKTEGQTVLKRIVSENGSYAGEAKALLGQ
jgi:tetratricopeptide (TPR) repeat protein